MLGEMLCLVSHSWSPLLNFMNNQEIILNNWRCFSENRLAWPSHSFLLMDQNGSGKTSLVAGMYSLFTGRAWPGTKLQDSLRQDKEYFGLDYNAGELVLTGKISPSGRLVSKYENNLPEPEKPKILTYLPTDNYWFNASRSQRLAVLDNLLSLLFDDFYETNLKQLEQTIRHKTQLIKFGQESLDLVDPILWRTLNQQIALFSERIWLVRAAYLFHLQQYLPEFDQWLQGTWSEKWQLSLEISNHHGLKDRLNLTSPDLAADKIRNLTQSFINDGDQLKHRELASGKVLFGAQRDEFKIVSKHREVQEVLSRGEIRLLVLFVKDNINRLLAGREKLLAEIPGLTDLNLQTHKVWWLLDDVFNELDEKRERILFQEILSQTDFFVATSTRQSFPEFQTYQLSELGQINSTLN
jgi:recombinational DNA repair ATPase RecF